MHWCSLSMKFSVPPMSQSRYWMISIETLYIVEIHACVLWVCALSHIDLQNPRFPLYYHLLLVWNQQPSTWIGVGSNEMSHHACHAWSQWHQQILLWRVLTSLIPSIIEKKGESGDIALNEGTPSIMRILLQNFENVYSFSVNEPMWNS